MGFWPTTEPTYLVDKTQKPEEKKNKKKVSAKHRKQRFTGHPHQLEPDPSRHFQCADSDCLAQPPILDYAHVTQSFVLHCDASQDGLAAVFYQRQLHNGNRARTTGQTVSLNSISLICDTTTLPPTSLSHRQASGKGQY